MSIPARRDQAGTCCRASRPAGRSALPGFMEALARRQHRQSGNQFHPVEALHDSGGRRVGVAQEKLQWPGGVGRSGKIIPHVAQDILIDNLVEATAMLPALAQDAAVVAPGGNWSDTKLIAMAFPSRTYRTNVR